MKNRVHLDGEDLLGLNILSKVEDEEFTKWVITRTNQQKLKLENQISELASHLGGQILVELEGNSVYIYFNERFTYEIVILQEEKCVSNKNYIYQIDNTGSKDSKEHRKLIFSQEAQNTKNLVHFWIKFQNECLE